MARGIDEDHVSHVISFELPSSPEDYLHRIGRTARISREGIAVSFVNIAERTFLQKIEAYLGGKIPEAVFPDSVTVSDYLPSEKQE